MFSSSPDIIEMIARFSAAIQRVQGEFERRLAHEGLTSAQLNVLSHLAQRGRQRVTDIAGAVNVGQPAVTKMLAKFEAAGWVIFKSSDEDRRSKLAHMTEDGLAHLQDVQKQLFDDLGEVLAHWSQADIEGFTEYLSRFDGIWEELPGKLTGR